jgi:hypothetical protein
MLVLGAFEGRPLAPALPRTAPDPAAPRRKITVAPDRAPASSGGSTSAPPSGRLSITAAGSPAARPPSVAAPIPGEVAAPRTGREASTAAARDERPLNPARHQRARPVSGKLADGAGETSSSDDESTAERPRRAALRPIDESNPYR